MVKNAKGVKNKAQKVACDVNFGALRKWGKISFSRGEGNMVLDRYIDPLIIGTALETANVPVGGGCRTRHLGETLKKN